MNLMNRSPSHFKPKAPAWNEIIAVSLLLALVCLLAWPGMTAPMILDDNDQAHYVGTFDSWKDCFKPDAYSQFRPIKNIIFYGMEGRPLFQWHVLGLSLYLAAIPVIYLFLRRLFQSPLWAFVAVVLWATSPTQVSTVIWLSCANISLAVLLACACLYFHDVAQAGSDRFGAVTLLACLLLFLSQTCYETAIAFPGVAVLLDMMRRRSLFTKKSMLRYGLLAAVTVIYLFLRFQFDSKLSIHKDTFIPDSPRWQLTISAPWFLWKHFSMWLMPLGRIEMIGTYIWGVSASLWELAAAWIWLLFIVGLIFYCWRRQPWIACGLLWFLVTSFPSSNFIPLGNGPIADYYVVFPGLGLAIAFVGCAKAVVEWYKRESGKSESNRKLIAGGLLCIGAFWRILCIPLFWLQADLWSRPIEMFARFGLTRTGQFHAQTYVASELLQLGQLDECHKLALKAYEVAPWDGLSSLLLGRVAFERKDYREAEERLLHAMRHIPESSPNSDHSRYYLAYAYFHQEGKRHLVRETLLKILESPQSPFHAKAIHLLVECYLVQGKWDDAMRAVSKAVALYPNDPDFAELFKIVEEKSRKPSP
jgi:Tetratricopeptide repeat